jgi:serine protease Do
VRALEATMSAARPRADALRRDSSDDALKNAAAKIEGICGAPSTTPRVAASYAAEWRSPARADVRKLTVVVRTRPPAPLAATFESFAEDDGPLAPLYHAVAEGGFGSGLVLVKGEGRDRRVFVITNRHVIDLSDEAEIMLDGGTSLGRVPVLYTDGWYDLAVLELPPAAPFEQGFAFATAPAKDQAPVIATGFPGIGDEPSYQTTRGYVSNERFMVNEEGRSLLYVQHTAPIDGGSSGGPLTDEAGALLGVNTLKLRGRENVGLAAPGFAVAEVARYASELRARAGDADWRRARARDACLALVGELGARTARVRVVEDMLSSWLVAREGVSSFRRVSDDPDMAQSWRRDPLEAMRLAVIIRLWTEAQALGGVDATETCERPDERDWANLTTSDRVSFTVRFARASRTVSLRWERGQWRLASTELFSASSPPPAGGKVGAAKKAGKKGAAKRR